MGWHKGILQQTVCEPTLELTALHLCEVRNGKPMFLIFVLETKRNIFFNNKVDGSLDNIDNFWITQKLPYKFLSPMTTFLKVI